MAVSLCDTAEANWDTIWSQRLAGRVACPCKQLLQYKMIVQQRVILRTQHLLFGYRHGVPQESHRIGRICGSMGD